MSKQKETVPPAPQARPLDELDRRIVRAIQANPKLDAKGISLGYSITVQEAKKRLLNPALVQQLELIQSDIANLLKVAAVGAVLKIQQIISGSNDKLALDASRLALQSYQDQLRIAQGVGMSMSASQAVVINEIPAELRAAIEAARSEVGSGGGDSDAVD